MELLNYISLLLGTSWGSGINLYLTVGLLGIAHRYEWLVLPGQLDTLAHPVVISVALILYAIEFIADKVPYVDSLWDSVHTFIRPAGGIALGYMAMTDFGPQFQFPVAVLTGTIALDAHLTKATTRAAINTSPEPITNSVASVSEDVAVVGIFFLMMQHPILATICVILFIIFSVWFLKKMMKFVKKVFAKPKQNSEKTANSKP